MKERKKKKKKKEELDYSREKIIKLNCTLNQTANYI